MNILLFSLGIIVYVFIYWKSLTRDKNSKIITSAAFWLAYGYILDFKYQAFYMPGASIILGVFLLSYRVKMKKTFPDEWLDVFFFLPTISLLQALVLWVSP